MTMDHLSALIELLSAVIETRNAQSSYFNARKASSPGTGAALDLARTLERSLDALVARLKKQIADQQQPKLF